MFQFSFGKSCHITSRLSFMELRNYLIAMMERITRIHWNGRTDELHRGFNIGVWENSNLKHENQKIPSDCVFDNYLVRAEREDVLEYVHNHLDLLAFAININIYTGRSMDHFIKGRFFNTHMLRRLLERHIPECTSEDFTDQNFFEVRWYSEDYEVTGDEAHLVRVLSECLTFSEDSYRQMGKIKIPSKYRRQ